MEPPKNLYNNSDRERSFFLWLSFVFQSFFSEYVFSLERSGSFFFFFFFIEHGASVYNLFCLLFFYSHSLAYRKRILIKMIWRPTKVGWGKKVAIERLEPSRLFFFGMVQSFSILEIQGYSGLHFTFFNPDFFYKPPQRRIFFLVSSLWWYGLSFFLYAKSYLYHLAMVRYNHYVEGAFAGAHKPLLRAVVIGKYRLWGRVRPTPEDFKSYIQERFAIFLYTGRFIFFKDRVKNESTTKYRTFKTKFYITEDIESDANIVSPARWRAELPPEAEDLYDSYLFSYRFWLKHKSLKALSDLHIGYVHSRHFWLHTFYYYFYFVHRYIQRSPKKYDFTYSWVNCWVSLPFIGSLWDYLFREFMGQFMKDLSARYLFFLLGSDGFFDINFAEAW